MITINSWEIAKLFGLVGPTLDRPANPQHEDDYSFFFHMYNQEIEVKYGTGDDDAVDEYEAKEEVAKRVLYAIGSVVSCALKDEF